MSLITNIQRILIEDFQEEDRPTVSKLANILNYFMTQTSDVVNGRLDFDNMNRQLITVDVTVDANGTPIQDVSFAATQGLIGGNVLSAQNLTNRAVFPTGCPFISYTPTGSGIYKINNIRGLVPNNRFRLTYEVVY